MHSIKFFTKQLTIKKTNEYLLIKSLNLNKSFTNPTLQNLPKIVHVFKRTI